jgi:hypothetical protein
VFCARDRLLDKTDESTPSYEKDTQELDEEVEENP